MGGRAESQIGLRFRRPINLQGSRRRADLSFKELKSGGLKVRIEGKGSCDPSLGHHEKADVVNEAAKRCATLHSVKGSLSEPVPLLTDG